MQDLPGMIERRTTADAVFEHLHKEITSLALPPGTKLSELEVARRFEVSRQPVREAFSRLSNLELVLVRPQKATVVRGFSRERVAQSRFVRLAVELEAVQQACNSWTPGKAKTLQKNLDEQRDALTSHPERFHDLDSQFHTLICELGGCPRAISAIAECRQKIDHLCSLSLARKSEAETLYEDHLELAQALKDKSHEKAIAIARLHLSRLDSVIDQVHQSHTEYFEE